MIVMTMGNMFFDTDKNVFNNILEMYETVLPFEWHSFCITLDMVKGVMKLYHTEYLFILFYLIC